MPKNRQIYFIGMLTCCLLGLTRESFFRESHEVKRLAQHFLREYILILFSSCIFDPWKCELAFVPSISSQSFMTAVRETLTLDLQTKCLRVIKNRTEHLCQSALRGAGWQKERKIHQLHSWHWGNLFAFCTHVPIGHLHIGVILQLRPESFSFFLSYLNFVNSARFE